MSDPNRESGENTTRGPWFVPIVVAVISLFTAMASNIDRIIPSVRELGVFGSANSTSQISGEWYGIFREYDPAKGEVITYDTIALEEKGSTIVGKMGTPAEGEVRAWNISGMFKHSTLVLNYLATDPEKKSIGTIVLEGKPGEGTPLKGYWLGYDKDRGQLVSCPYILTKRTNTELVKKENGPWLERPCYWMNS